VRGSFAATLLRLATVALGGGGNLQRCKLHLAIVEREQQAGTYRAQTHSAFRCTSLLCLPSGQPFPTGPRFAGSRFNINAGDRSTFIERWQQEVIDIMTVCWRTTTTQDALRTFTGPHLRATMSCPTCPCAPHPPQLQLKHPDLTHQCRSGCLLPLFFPVQAALRC
jgi:hypothetical protein